MERSDFKILVADDDESVREVIVDIILREGYGAESAPNGTEALAKILKSRYHLVITDLKMPGADGLEILRRALSLDPDTSIVIMTAYATLQSALEAVKEGAYDYVTKPFRVEELLVTVGNAYKRTQLIVQNRFLLEKLRGEDSRADSLGSLERLAKLKESGFVDEEEFITLKSKIMESIKPGDDRQRK